MPYQLHVLNALMRVKPGILILVRDLSPPFRLTGRVRVPGSGLGRLQATGGRYAQRQNPLNELRTMNESTGCTTFRLPVAGFGLHEALDRTAEV